MEPLTKKEDKPPIETQAKVNIEKLDGKEYPYKVRVTAESEEYLDRLRNRLRGRVGVDKDRHTQVAAKSKGTGYVASVGRYEEVTSDSISEGQFSLDSVVEIQDKKRI